MQVAQTFVDDMFKVVAEKKQSMQVAQAFVDNVFKVVAETDRLTELTASLTDEIVDALDRHLFECKLPVSAADYVDNMRTIYKTGLPIGTRHTGPVAVMSVLLILSQAVDQLLAGARETTVTFAEQPVKHAGLAFMHMTRPHPLRERTMDVHSLDSLSEADMAALRHTAFVEKDDGDKPLLVYLMTTPDAGFFGGIYPLDVEPSEFRMVGHVYDVTEGNTTKGTVRAMHLSAADIDSGRLAHIGIFVLVRIMQGIRRKKQKLHDEASAQPPP